MNKVIKVLCKVFVLGLNIFLVNSSILAKAPIVRQSVNFHDILLVQGFGAALHAVQEKVAAGDGLQSSEVVATSKKKSASKAAVPVSLATPNPKEQEVLHGFISRMVPMALTYVPQGSVVGSAVPPLLEQAVEVVVDVVRTPLVAAMQKADLIRTVLPQLKTKPFKDQEIAAWVAIRPILGAYLQPDGTVAHLHPLQEEAVVALQVNIAAFKGVQLHTVLAQRFTKALELVATRALHTQSPPTLTRLASLEQWQQLQATVAESDFVKQPTKDLFKLAADRVVVAISNLRALVTLLTPQVAADNAVPLAMRITNCMQYMNQCDVAFKQLPGISPDAFIDVNMQALRNTVAQALVDMVQKKTPDVQASLTSLLQRSVETGLLGKAQRNYVNAQMLPQLDNPTTKNERDVAMKRFGKKSSK